MDSNVVVPKGFKLKTQVEPQPKTDIPAGFKIKPALEIPKGFKLKPMVQPEPVVEGKPSTVQPANNSELADSSSSSVAPAARLAAVEDAAMKIPVVGPLVKASVAPTRIAMQYGSEFMKEDTPELAKSREAIRIAGKLPDESTAGQDLKAGIQAMTGSTGRDLLEGHKSYKYLSSLSKDKSYGPEWVQFMDQRRRNAAKLIADKAKLPEIPVNPVVAEIARQTKDKDFIESSKLYGTALATAPYEVMRTVTLRSLPQSWKPILGSVLGAAAGSVVAPGPGSVAGGAVGGAVGSYDTEYDARIIDGITRYGGDIRNEKSILDTLDKYGDKIEKEASREAAVIATTDMIAGGAAAKIATLPLRGVAGTAVKIGLGSASDAGLSAAGEAGAQVATRGKVADWDSVFQEALGSVGSGAFMEAGMVGVEKLMQTVQSGKKVDEETLLKAWKESLPEEPVSSFTESLNSGRTYYGFIKDGETQTVVGDYDSAEKVMGQNDVRTGRLIAVREEETVESSELDLEVATAVDNYVLAVVDAKQTKIESTAFKARGDLLDSIRKSIKYPIFNSPEGRSVLDAIETVAKAVQSDAPETVAASAQMLKSVLQPLLPPVRIYKGDGFGQRILPRLDNDLLLGDYVYDLDELQLTAKRKGGILVPDAPLPRLSVTPEIATLVDATFEFESDKVKADFLHYGVFTRADLMAQGKVKWKGRADPRFFGEGEKSVDDLIYVKPDSGAFSRISQDEMLNARRANGRTEVFPLSIMRNPGFSKEYDKPIQEWLIKSGFATNRKKVLHVAPSVVKTQSVNILNSWLKKFPLNQNIMFIEVPVENSGVPTLTGNGLISYIRSSYPGIPETLLMTILDGFKQVITYPGVGAYAHPVSGDFSLLVVKQLPQNSDTLASELNLEILSHEFGHIVSADMLFSAPLDTLLEIRAAHRRMREAFDRRSSIDPSFETKVKTIFNQNPETQVPNQPYRYVKSFEEWWAHQFSRWMLSNPVGLGPIAQLERATGRKILEILKEAKLNKKDFRAEPEVEKFLASVKNRSASLGYADVLMDFVEKQTLEANAKPFGDSPEEAVPAYENLTAGTRAILRKTIQANSLFSSPVPKQAKKNAAAAVSLIDRFGWIYKWAANLRQLSEANPHIAELQIARELFGQVKIDTAKIHVSADATLQKWRQLGSKRAKALSQFVFELDQMTYRTADEVESGVIRWPTKDEFFKMATELKLDQETLQVYGEVRDFFLNSVRRLEELRLFDAARIVDPEIREAAIKSAKADSVQLIKKPYFPQTRFGTYSLTVRKADGTMEGFWLFETAREAKQVAEAMKQNEYPDSEYKMVLSTLPEEVAPFVGMSPWMLDKMRELPGLKSDQLDWIDQLRYQMAPSRSFVKHMMRRKNIIGASQEGMRVFANYAFHHGRNYGRTKYASSFRDIIASLRKSLPAGYQPTEISKRNAMADMVQHQVNELMNPSRDWAMLRSFNAIWHLGFNVKSAVVNSTQIFVTSAFLGAKFGGVKAEAALLSASTKLSSYYRKGSLEILGQTDGEFRAIDRAIKDGHIDESMAAELAAVAIGGGVGQRLGKSLFGDKFTTSYINFTEKAMWMQRMTDQWQRRLTFRAAWKLAMENPNNKWLQSLKSKHAMQFEILQKESWTEREALAYLAGLDASVQSQGTYDRQSRPRYMQGRKSVLFAFQLFTQQNLWMLANNKDMWMRYSLYMLALGGAMGLLPDDLENVIEGVGKTAFGKDFNLKRGMRDFVVSMFDDRIPPDLILHGGARYGFGAHAVAEMVGAPFVPEVDFSTSMGLGRLAPIDVSKISQPGATASDVIAAQTETTAGAAYGIPISLMKAMMASEYDLTDFKRWEGAMPAAMRNLARSWRYAQEGNERTKSGAVTMGFDGEDPEQLGEIIGIALGFRPTRQSQQYDRVAAEREIDQYWSTQKEMLLRQAYRDRFVYKDEEAYQDTLKQIREFNQRAIAAKYKISSDAMITSFKRRRTAAQKIENNASTPPQVRSMVDRLYPETKEGPAPKLK